MTNHTQSKHRMVGSTPDDGPPPYDAPAVGRVARVAQITGVDLVALQFNYQNIDPAVPLDARVPDGFGLKIEWVYEPGLGEFNCDIDLTVLEDDDSDEGLGFELAARLRLRYELKDEQDIAQVDLQQFAHWNAVYNGWSYWRELVSSIASRAALPNFIVPLFGVPRPND